MTRWTPRLCTGLPPTSTSSSPTRRSFAAGDQISISSTKRRCCCPYPAPCTEGLSTSSLIPTRSPAALLMVSTRVLLR